MSVWRVRVQGTPAPKGSLQCIGARGKIKHQLIEDDKTGDRAAWRARLTAAASELAGRLPDRGDAGVIVGVLVLVERPPSTPRGRALPVTRSAGDVDKHARMTLDALDDAQVFGDDSRVALVLAAKAFTVGAPGAVVYVAPIGEDPRRILEAMLTESPALTGPTTLV